MNSCLNRVISLLTIYLHVQAIKFMTHSINDIRLLKKFIQKGQTSFKFDISPMTVESCQKYAGIDRFPETEIASDEIIGCLGLVGDMSELPYATNRFQTSQDLLTYLGSAEFYQYSRIKKQKIIVQMNLLALRQLTPKRVLVIRFLNRVIDLMEQNEYLQVILSNRFPESLGNYCRSHSVECQPLLLEINRIVNNRKFFVEWTYTWPAERQVHNVHAIHVDYECRWGFEHAYSLLPYLFWEYNDRSYLRDFLRLTEFECPTRNGHEIQMESNVDVEYFNKIVYFDVLPPPVGQIYQKLSLTPGQSFLLGTAWSSDAQYVVHVSNSVGGIFDFQFASVNKEGKITFMNKLSYAQAKLGAFCSVHFEQQSIVAFWENAIIVHSVSPQGGKFDYQIQFDKPVNRLTTELLSANVSTKKFEWLTVGKLDTSVAEIVKISMQGESIKELNRVSVPVGELALIELKKVEIRVQTATRDVCLAISGRTEKTDVSCLTTFNFDYSKPKKWTIFVGSLMDIAVDFRSRHFAITIGDSPRYYGHEVINNNNFDYCSAYRDFEKTILRPQFKHSTVYFFGRLDYLSNNNDFDIGEQFVSPCDPGLIYGLVGASMELKIQLITHNNEQKLLISEHPATTSQMEAYTNILSFVFDETSPNDLLVYELQPHRFFPAKQAKANTRNNRILVSSLV